MSKKNIFIKVIIPILILVSAGVVTKFIISSRSMPVRKVHSNPGVLVEAVKITPQPYQMIINTSGTLRPAQEVHLASEVAGRVVYVNPDLKDGTLIKAGALLFRIDGSNYKTALDNAKASLAKTELERDLAINRAEVAKAEWENFGPDKQASPLTLNKPQVASAKAAVDAAKGTVKKASLDLKRTEIRAPFTAIVRTEQVEIGQYLQPGAAVVTLVGTSSMELVAAVPTEDIPFIELPRPGIDSDNGKGNESMALLEIRKGGMNIERTGAVIRSLGEVSKQGRMQQVVIGIPDPFAIKNSELTPLHIGEFASVKITGRSYPSVMILPVEALRDNNTVWTVDSESLLKTIEVEPIRRTTDGVIIKDSLPAGTEIIVSPLGGAADGLKVRQGDQKGASTEMGSAK